MSVVALLCVGAVWVHLYNHGQVITTVWLTLNILDTLKATRQVRPNGRRIGVQTRQKALRHSLISWVVFIVVQGCGSVMEGVLGWLPFYSHFRIVFSLAFLLCRSAVSLTIYDSIISPLVGKYETPIDLSILLIESLALLVYHFILLRPLILVQHLISRGISLIWRVSASTFASAGTRGAREAAAQGWTEVDGQGGSIDLDSLEEEDVAPNANVARPKTKARLSPIRNRKEAAEASSIVNSSTQESAEVGLDIDTSRGQEHLDVKLFGDSSLGNESELETRAESLASRENNATPINTCTVDSKPFKSMSSNISPRPTPPSNQQRQVQRPNPNLPPMSSTELSRVPIVRAARTLSKISTAGLAPRRPINNMGERAITKERTTKPLPMRSKVTLGSALTSHSRILPVPVTSTRTSEKQTMEAELDQRIGQVRPRTSRNEREDKNQEREKEKTRLEVLVDPPRPSVRVSRKRSTLTAQRVNIALRPGTATMEREAVRRGNDIVLKDGEVKLDKGDETRGVKRAAPRQRVGEGPGESAREKRVKVGIGVGVSSTSNRA